jgi:undecaprenyl-diphosphatase
MIAQVSSWEAAVLGIVQGLFMFIPVSSTSHLALTQHWLLDRGSTMPAPDSPEMILFDIIVHVGTLVSIVVVMRASLSRVLGGVLTDAREVIATRQLTDRRYLRLAGLGLVTVAVTGVLGLIVRAFGTGAFAAPAVIAVCLLITGAILWWTDTAGPQWRDAERLTVWVAVAIGVAQAAALLPGLSRSGLTIAMALALGMHRKLAAEYSFFVAIPTILAAAAVQAVDVARDEALTFTIEPSAYLIGFLTAAVVGAAALVVVLRLLYQARFRYFSIYVVALAAAILIIQPSYLG